MDMAADTKNRLEIITVRKNSTRDYGGNLRPAEEKDYEPRKRKSASRRPKKEEDEQEERKKAPSLCRGNCRSSAIK
ncbi:hypothetical protein TNCV_2865231 [Trichonephila clavipes]|nr:hypothetical protein TNCV_2865231 [Trichonephila clavipes]